MSTVNAVIHYCSWGTCPFDWLGLKEYIWESMRLRDITCLNRIQVILKLHGDKLSKSQALLAGHIKIEFINQNKWNGHNFSLKYIELILVTLSSITPIGAK